MILRRVIAHFKKQEWTAIALDFLIVVLGVFIGIQVANWNAARQERGLEARTIERLHDEVRTLIAARAGRRQFSIFVRDGLDDAARTLFSADPAAVLSPEACEAMLLSHVYLSQPDDLPVFEELIATGRVDVITNAEIKSALLNFMRARDHGRTTLQSVGRDIQRLSIRFPELIAVSLTPGANETDLAPSAACDANAMRADQGFLNTLIGNRAIHQEYVDKMLDAVDAPLGELHAELENTAGPDHHDHEQDK